MLQFEPDHFRWQSRDIGIKDAANARKKVL